MAPTGSTLLHEVATRILGRYLERTGATSVVVSRALRDEAIGVDLQYTRGAEPLTAKVKADAYFGSDPLKIADRALPFYRAQSGTYGLESMADTATREPGWLQRSQADDLFYYRLVIAQPEDVVAELFAAHDAEFFAKLAVERDELKIIPMRALREWYEKSADRYAPRPVVTDGRPAWYRIVTEKDLDTQVPGVRAVGSVYHRVIAI
ncbi:MAG: hypothetical protein ISP10_04615 [Aeromicrobium sp.]|jgi:hypothetical protein|nr:hypothetical protein [Aeromicrobium sp.]